ncbi:MAG TPA: ethanolamine utilization protein EutN [Caldithrix abyssi]|uniref:Ethanolamine utilization protein EutN n=1 Tax=Caldithrix abyssi TaxID=187145 RepID=A0A7V5VE47_CALAY|nr:ethanolamine utilization protein EutN [Caldithrix abyssi]
MTLGKVIGTVWATRKDEKLTGLKLLLVRPVELDYSLKDGYVVAADSVGAGVGEIVMITTGSSARQSELTAGKPVDAVISGIIDKLDISE